MFKFFLAILEASVCVSVIELCENVVVMVLQGVGGREVDVVSNGFGSIRDYANEKVIFKIMPTSTYSVMHEMYSACSCKHLVQQSLGQQYRSFYTMWKHPCKQTELWENANFHSLDRCR